MTNLKEHNQASGTSEAAPRRGRGRPRGSTSKVSAGGREDGGLSMAHANFVRAAMNASTSSIDLSKVLDLYLGHAVVSTHGNHARALVKDLYGRFLAAAGQHVRALEDGLAKLTGQQRVEQLQQVSYYQAVLAKLAPLDPLDPLASLQPPSPDASSSQEPVRPRKLPTLDEWIDMYLQEHPEADLEEFGQAELLELYKADLGIKDEPVAEKAIAVAGQPPSPTESSSAGDKMDLPTLLRDFMRVASLVVVSPSPSDRCERWLLPSVSKSLASVRVETVAQLKAFVESRGNRWWKDVPRLGQVRADRVLAWLVNQFEGTESPVSARAATRASTYASAAPGQPSPHALAQFGHVPMLLWPDDLVPEDLPRSFGLVPLERLQVPPALDGSRGKFRRSEPNSMGVGNDLEAIREWLRGYSEKEKTVFSYHWAVEVFYLWCLTVRGRSLGDIVEADVVSFAAFLSDPPSSWIQPKVTARHLPEWRPLRKGLSDHSRRQVLRVLRAMYGAFQDAAYLTANPISGPLKRLALPKSILHIDRRFDDPDWVLLMREVLRMQDSPGKRRAIAVLELGTAVGLRRSEIVAVTAGDLKRETFDGESVWMLKVAGKGGKVREVPVPDDVVSAVFAHQEDRRDLGLRPFTDPGLDTSTRDAIPLISPIQRPTLLRGAGDTAQTGDEPFGERSKLDPTALYQSLKRLFRDVAESLRGRDAHAASRIARASTHFLRHTFGKTSVEAGVEITALQAAFGHASLQTTSIYTEASKRHMVKELRKRKQPVLFDAQEAEPPSAASTGQSGA